MFPRSVRRKCPSGEKAMARIQRVWPSRALQHNPVAASHNRTVLSPEADATSCPSGEKATSRTTSVWPLRMLRYDPVAASHNRTVPSPEADATSCPSGEKATAWTTSVWPSRTLWEASQSPFLFDNIFTHLGISSSKVFRIILASGAKIRAEEYICRGASSSIRLNRSENRSASLRKLERALFDAYVIG
jgi:hypothetical protein